MIDSCNKKTDYLVSMFVSLILLCIAWTICGINFETNDDTGIMMFVTGAKTGFPTAETIFCNILWGGFLSSLYKLNESIPWYIITYIILIWTVLSIVCNCCIKVFRKNYIYGDKPTGEPLSIVCGVLVFCVLYFSIFVYYSVFFQFTTVAALCGLGAILLMICFPEGGRVNYIVFFILLFFADTIRPKIGYMTTAAFFLVIVISYYLCMKPNLIYPIITGIIQFLTFLINAFYEYFNGWTDFRKYHIARALWKDYMHPSFKDNPLLYESANWTESLYKLADKWFFMDRRVNTAAFEYLGANRHAILSFKEKYFKMFLKTPQLRMTFILMCIIVIVIIVYFIYKRNNKGLLIILSACFLTATILLYFLLKGRLPYRGSFPVIILFMLPTIFILLFKGNIIEKTQGFFLFLYFLLTLLITVYSFCGQNGLTKITYLLSKDSTRLEGIQAKKDVEQYAIDHQDNIYIYDYSLTMSGSPFITYSKGKPYNLMSWGGSGMYSPPYYDQLAANGLKELYSDKFFKNNIFFLGRSKPDPDLIEYMQNEISESVSIEITDVANNFIVYRFNR